jgi:hypothetical protein
MTNLITLTENETRAIYVLINACLDGMGGKHIDDLNDDPYTWVGHDNLVDAGWSQGSAKGTFGSLVAKGLIDEADKNEFAINHDAPEVRAAWLECEGADETPAPVADVTDEETVFVNALELAAEQEELARSMGNPFPGIICSTIRAHAAGWTGTRKDFIAAGQAVGFNKHTLSTQWQRARGK